MFRMTSAAAASSRVEWPQVFYTLGLHEVTDIYTVTRTDYTPQGDVEIKLSLSGWFETGPLLPRKAHFINFRPEHIADDFTLVTMTGGDSPTAKISGTLYVENKGVHHRPPPGYNEQKNKGHYGDKHERQAQLNA